MCPLVDYYKLSTRLTILTIITHCTRPHHPVNLRNSQLCQYPGPTLLNKQLNISKCRCLSTKCALHAHLTVYVMNHSSNIPQSLLNRAINLASIRLDLLNISPCLTIFALLPAFHENPVSDVHGSGCQADEDLWDVREASVKGYYRLGPGADCIGYRAGG